MIVWAKESCWEKKDHGGSEVKKTKKKHSLQSKDREIQSRKKVVCATLKREGIREGRMEAKEKKGGEEE